MSSQISEAQANQLVIQQTLSRIASHNGVLGYIVVHPSDGRILDFVGFADDKTLVDKYARNLYSFSLLAQSTVRTIDQTEDLTFIRMRWAQREVLIAPDSNKEYILIVVQDQVQQSIPAQVADAPQQQSM